METDDKKFRIRRISGDDIYVSVEEYTSLRNKIKANLSKFYSDVDFTDASTEEPLIVFFMTIYGKHVIKKFEAAEWIDAEREGRFNEMYTEFTKTKKASSARVSELAGNGDGKFRKKKVL
ncbi:hypothetical protein [Pedobacter sp. Leaf170]|uniref:hypothetical protein n=1 Tax=Pedobacter sp. Leaf170 TaxID=2876558 RepID=UPI001E4FEA99|nr:hypothetical protein [Pedobacter sp. Leaf170]